MERLGYGYAIIGGIANQLWGRARFTYDVELKVLVPDTDYALARCRIRETFPDRARSHLPENPLIVDIRVSGVIVDFLLAVQGYEENIVTRALSCDLDGLHVWVCAPEDLIIQKAIAGRTQDWQDIEGILIEQHRSLDRASTEDWLKQFAEALDRPELLSQYETLQTRIRTILNQGM